jgi:cytochrome c oxidase accessory protein FixG
MGYTFLPTDTLLFMFVMGSGVVGIFLLTALFGRVWCGWACPQTVYLEYLFRPIGRWFDGGYTGARNLDKRGAWFTPRRFGKYLTFFLLALFVSHTFLAFFVGTGQLYQWMSNPPAEHPSAFFFVVVFTGIVWFNFTYFREQTCLIVCPYGRWQSALIDQRSLIVAYDVARGEPRRAGKDRRPEDGDCVSCNACVVTCPTGIDIRNGLQMECVHCTQCIDACDHVMTALHKPKGLIRYASQEELAGNPGTLWRPRVVLYSAALAVVLGTLALTLGTRAEAEIIILRSSSEPYRVEADGRVANQLRVKIVNRSNSAHDYAVQVDGLAGGTVIAPELPLRIEPGAQRTTSLFLLADPDLFDDGRHNITLRVTDGAGFTETLPFTVLGPAQRSRREGDRSEQSERAPEPR